MAGVPGGGKVNPGNISGAELPYLAAREGKAYWSFGDLYTIKVSGEETDGGFALVEILARPNNGAPPHAHLREHETFYVLEGKFSFLYEESTLTTGPGGLVQIPRGTRHSFNNLGSEPARVLVLVAPSGLEKFFIEMGVPAGDKSSLPPSGDFDRKKFKRLAAEYAIEFRPPLEGL